MKFQDNGGGPVIDCRACGSFKVTDLAVRTVEALSPSQKANLAGWIRDNPNAVISTRNLETLATLKSPSVGEKADKALLFLAKRFPKPGGNIYFDDPVMRSLLDTLPEQTLDLPSWSELKVVTWSQDHEEVMFIFSDYLQEEKGFLKLQARENGTDLRITPKGWAHIHDLTQSNAESTTAFVAMWFNQSVDAAYTAMAEAISAAGFSPLRIDKKQHNNKIDDEIIAAIRRSRFVVADFTGHRGGVYYEAGYAGGREIPVIWLCRKNDFDNIHFDTRQFNFLLWEEEDLVGLRTMLQNRIEATIGHRKTHLRNARTVQVG